MCNMCHNVSSPAFENDETGESISKELDMETSDFSAHKLLPVERTYSEWFYSEYNTMNGVYTPQFGGN